MSDHVRTLADLGLAAQNGREVRITGLSVDSRETKAGHLFAALPGSRVHGAEFVQYAVRMGAVAVLTDRDGARMLGDLGDVALVVAEEPRQALAYASALWFGATPARSLQ